MKNLKKISRNSLKQIKGGGIITGCDGKEEGAFCDWVSAGGYGTGSCGYDGIRFRCIPD